MVPHALRHLEGLHALLWSLLTHPLSRSSVSLHMVGLLASVKRL